MQFCGGHTHALWRYGIVGMLPDAVEMIHGPGCPVCVLPIGRLEQAIAVREEFAAACELLGLDPLHLANEGKVVAICEATSAPRLLEAMRADPLGRDATILGEVVEDEQGFVRLDTAFGGSRILDWLTGEALPRIC
jgi:hydrogenase maturation factor